MELMETIRCLYGMKLIPDMAIQAKYDEQRAKAIATLGSRYRLAKPIDKLESPR